MKFNRLFYRLMSIYYFERGFHTIPRTTIDVQSSGKGPIQGVLSIKHPIFLYLTTDNFSFLVLKLPTSSEYDVTVSLSSVTQFQCILIRLGDSGGGAPNFTSINIWKTALIERLRHREPLHHIFKQLLWCRCIQSVNSAVIQLFLDQFIFIGEGYFAQSRCEYRN